MADPKLTSPKTSPNADPFAAPKRAGMPGQDGGQKKRDRKPLLNTKNR